MRRLALFCGSEISDRGIEFALLNRGGAFPKVPFPTPRMALDQCVTEMRDFGKFPTLEMCSDFNRGLAIVRIRW